MEELLKLQNEYEKTLHNSDRLWKDGFSLNYEQEYMRDFRVAYLISKSYGFIKWLVDNDKIDLEELEKELSGMGIRYNIGYYEGLLMVLSISDSPVNDLISYLK